MEGLEKTAEEGKACPTAPNQVPFKMLQKAVRRWMPVVWGTKRKKYRGLGEMCDPVVGPPGWPPLRPRNQENTSRAHDFGKTAMLCACNKTLADADAAVPPICPDPASIWAIPSNKLTW
jgi:hypothetical protein